MVNLRDREPYDALKELRAYADLEVETRTRLIIRLKPNFNPLEVQRLIGQVNSLYNEIETVRP